MPARHLLLHDLEKLGGAWEQDYEVIVTQHADVKGHYPGDSADAFPEVEWLEAESQAMERVRATVINCCACAGDPVNDAGDFDEDEIKMTADWRRLPDLVLFSIVDFLCPEDVARLGQACRRFHSLVPRFLVMRGKDFHVQGPTYHQSVTVGAPPEVYFDGPPFTSAVKKLTMSLVWKDQGWGNLKGEIFMKLMRPAASGVDVVVEKRRLFGIAKHQEERAKAVLSDSPVVRQVQSGDFYRFMRNVGSGGGHELTVKKFRVVAWLSKNSDV